MQEGSFAGMDIGAHWVHGGESNAVMAALLAYTGVEAITVGGAWNLEGARLLCGRFCQVGGLGRPLTRG